MTSASGRLSESLTRARHAADSAAFAQAFRARRSSRTSTRSGRTASRRSATSPRVVVSQRPSTRTRSPATTDLGTSHSHTRGMRGSSASSHSRSTKVRRFESVRRFLTVPMIVADDGAGSPLISRGGGARPRPLRPPPPTTRVSSRRHAAWFCDLMTDVVHRLSEHFDPRHEPSRGPCRAAPRAAPAFRRRRTTSRCVRATRLARAAPPRALRGGVRRRRELLPGDREARGHPERLPHGRRREERGHPLHPRRVRRVRRRRRDPVHRPVP